MANPTEISLAYMKKRTKGHGTEGGEDLGEIQKMLHFFIMKF